MGFVPRADALITRSEKASGRASTSGGGGVLRRDVPISMLNLSERRTTAFVHSLRLPPLAAAGGIGGGVGGGCGDRDATSVVAVRSPQWFVVFRLYTCRTYPTRVSWV